MTANPSTQALDELAEAGVAIWLDDLSRDRLTSGNLADLTRTHRVVGVTTNPTIFAGALAGGHAYDAQLASLAAQGQPAERAVWAITTADVRAAADVLMPIHVASGGIDGRVSIEVDPRLARDTSGTIDQARELWARVDRPNLFIKIPATAQGLPAIAQVLADGISVNVTLIFSLERYRQVLDAFQSGLERAHAAGRDLAPIGSVASFFVSRVDSAVDAQLDAIGTPAAAAVRGKAAIANARLAFELYERALDGERWQRLAAVGARPQRPLWASTGVKDKAYPDTRYVDELVAAGVVNTMPEATLVAVADHGHVRGDTISGTADDARGVLADLAALGIAFDAITTSLEHDGVAKFEKSWRDLLGTIEDGLTRTAGATRAGATRPKEASR